MMASVRRVPSLVAGSLIALTACTTSVQTDQGSGAYVNEEAGFAIEGPEGWVQQENVAGSTVSFLVPVPPEDGFAENINVIVQDAGPMGLEEYTELSLEELHGLGNGAEVVEEGEAELGGQPAHRAVTRTNMEGRDLRILQLWTIHEGRAYVLTLSLIHI